MTAANLAAHLATLPEVQAELKALGWTPPEEKPQPVPSPLGDWTRMDCGKVYHFIESPQTQVFSNTNDMLFLVANADAPLAAAVHLFCHADWIEHAPAALAALLATNPTP
jgi:hypothetical protein